jgi:C1A family cysteine protease
MPGQLIAVDGLQFGLGWKRDLPDHRDFFYAAPPQILRQGFPSSVDLRAQFPEPYDQGQIGSCTANAIAGLIQFIRLKNHRGPDFTPSRLFIYYNERAMEGTIPLDAGAFLRDGMKSVAKEGVCPESEWPYEATPAAVETHLFPAGSRPVTRPLQKCYQDAEQYKVTAYFGIIQSMSPMKACLAEGYPFTVGFTVYNSMWDHGRAVTNLPYPSGNDEVRGGHAVLAVGYDDAKQAFIIRNSWGPNVQDHGHFYMPYAYVLDPRLSADFWTIRQTQTAVA